MKKRLCSVVAWMLSVVMLLSMMPVMAGAASSMTGLQNTDVTPAELKDDSGNSPYNTKQYEVVVNPELNQTALYRNSSSNLNKVRLHIEKLEQHINTSGLYPNERKEYWVGFSVNAPGLTETYVRFAYANSPEQLKEIDFDKDESDVADYDKRDLGDFQIDSGKVYKTNLSNSQMSFYFVADKTENRYCKVRFYKTSTDKKEYDDYSFEVDTSMVFWDTGLKPLKRRHIVIAPHEDDIMSVGDARTIPVYNEDESLDPAFLTFNVMDPSEGASLDVDEKHYTKVTLNMKDLDAHVNKDLDSNAHYWAGFTVIAPSSGAQSAKIAFATDMDKLEQFTEKNMSTVALSETDDGTPCYSFYVDAALPKEKQERFCKIMFLNSKGNPITEVYRFEIDTTQNPSSEDAFGVWLANTVYVVAEDVITEDGDPVPNGAIELPKPRSITLQDGVTDGDGRYYWNVFYFRVKDGYTPKSTDVASFFPSTRVDPDGYRTYRAEIGTNVSPNTKIVIRTGETKNVSVRLLQGSNIEKVPDEPLTMDATGASSALIQVAAGCKPLAVSNGIATVTFEPTEDANVYRAIVKASESTSITINAATSDSTIVITPHYYDDILHAAVVSEDYSQSSITDQIVSGGTLTINAAGINKKVESASVYLPMYLVKELSDNQVSLKVETPVGSVLIPSYQIGIITKGIGATKGIGVVPLTLTIYPRGTQNGTTQYEVGLRNESTSLPVSSDLLWSQFDTKVNGRHYFEIKLPAKGANTNVYYDSDDLHYQETLTTVPTATSEFVEFKSRHLGMFSVSDKPLSANVHPNNELKLIYDGDKLGTVRLKVDGAIDGKNYIVQIDRRKAGSKNPGAKVWNIVQYHAGDPFTIHVSSMNSDVYDYEVMVVQQPDNEEPCVLDENKEPVFRFDRNDVAQIRDTVLVNKAYLTTNATNGG